MEQKHWRLSSELTAPLVLLEQTIATDPILPQACALGTYVVKECVDRSEEKLLQVGIS